MFRCEFNRSVFERLCEISNDEEHPDTGALGQFFTPEQMGAIMKMQVFRAGLSNNSVQVLDELIQRLNDENRKQTAGEGDLLEYLKELKEKKS